MLQYKKASLLPEIGWDFSSKSASSEPIDSNNPAQESGNFCFPQTAAESLQSKFKSKSDTKLIPLLLCHLTSRINVQRQYLGCVQSTFKRNTFDSDQLEIIGQDEDRVLLLYSPDLRASCAIRFADPAQCFLWSDAIQKAIETANAKAISEANQVLRDVLDSSIIKHMGWVTERMDDGQMRCTFLVLTATELFFYDFVPWTAANWSFPIHGYPLVHSRLVCPDQADQLANTLLESKNGSSNINSADTCANALTIRFGTCQGVVVVHLFFESQKSLLHWANLIVQNANNTVLALGESTFGKKSV